MATKRPKFPKPTFVPVHVPLHQVRGDSRTGARAGGIAARGRVGQDWGGPALLAPSPFQSPLVQPISRRTRRACCEGCPAWTTSSRCPRTSHTSPTLRSAGRRLPASSRTSSCADVLLSPGNGDSPPSPDTSDTCWSRLSSPPWVTVPVSAAEYSNPASPPTEKMEPDLAPIRARRSRHPTCRADLAQMRALACPRAPLLVVDAAPRLRQHRAAWSGVHTPARWRPPNSSSTASA